jgi:hypothetical protein
MKGIANDNMKHNKRMEKMSHRSYKGSNFSSCRNSSSQYTGPTAIHQNRKI